MTSDFLSQAIESLSSPSNRSVPFHASRASARRVSVAAFVALAAMAGGCAGTGTQSDGLTLLGGPEAKVPERRLVGTNSTPVQTASARGGRGSRALSQPQDGLALALPGTATATTTTWTTGATTGTTAGSTTDATDTTANTTATSVNAPLFISDSDNERGIRPASLGLPGAYLPTRLPSDEKPTEGATNLSQVSFALEGGDFAPDIDRDAAFMVYASTQHRSTFDLYRKSIDGRTVTLLTDDPSDDMMPVISPDGTTVAFASNRNGNWDIFTMPIAGGAPTQVTFDADEEVQPTWAPDGKRLAFSRLNGRSGSWEIWIIDTSSTGVRSFVCEGFQPRWAPVESADKLLFQRARQRGSRLYGVWTIELQNGEGVRPTEILSASNAAILQPNWSPDGDRIVFTTVTNPTEDDRWPERSDLWVISADGTGRTNLTRDQFRNMQPVWAGDGRVYFVSNRGGVENVWAVTVDRTPSATPAPVAASRPAKPSRKVAGAGSNSTGATNTATATEEAKTTASAPDFLRADQAGSNSED